MCYPGGEGLYVEDLDSVAMYCGLAGLIMFAAIQFVRWKPRWTQRIVFSVVTALAWATLMNLPVIRAFDPNAS